LTESTDPFVAETVAQIRDQLTAGTPHMVLNIPAGAGKTAIINALLREPALLSSGRSVKRSIAELDQLHSSLERCERIVVIYDPVHASGRASVVTAPTTAIASPADAADHPWSSVVGSFDAGRRTPHDAGEPVMFGPPESLNTSPSLTFDEYILACLRQQLLRLVHHLRIVMRLRLICVLSRLSRIPDLVNFVLLLLAAARCYGHRTDPSDHALPVPTSISVVTGRLPALS
jgi:hypothetical protein